MTIASQLERYRDKNSEEYKTIMPEETALLILQSATQNTYTQDTGISYTQYSPIYNNANKTMKVWSFQDFTKSYSFDVNGKQIFIR